VCASTDAAPVQPPPSQLSFPLTNPPGRNVERKQEAAQNKVGYPFVAYPTHIMGPLVSQGKLKPRDETVVRILLSFANQFRDSCWCRIKTIATQANCSEDTVNRSLARLEKHGVVSHRKVAETGEPDPLQPPNKTGWRFVFLWCQTLHYPTEGPDRRPPIERKKPRFQEASGQMQLFAPPRMATVPSPSIATVPSQSKKEVKLDPKLSQKTTTTAQGNSRESPARDFEKSTPGPESSSFFSAPRPEDQIGRTEAAPRVLPSTDLHEATVDETKPPAELVDQSELDRLAQRWFAMVGWPLGQARCWIHDELGRRRVKNPQYQLAWIGCAFDEMDRKGRRKVKNWDQTYIVGVLNNWPNGPPPTTTRPNRLPEAPCENWNPGPRELAKHLLNQLRFFGCDLEPIEGGMLKPIGDEAKLKAVPDELWRQLKANKLATLELLAEERATRSRPT